MPYEPYLLIPLRRHDESLRAHAIINAADAHLASHRWCLNHGYALRKERVDGAWRMVALHRAVLGLVYGDGLEGDHIDGNTLDCRRSNLRIVTQPQNTQNRKPRAGGSSMYRGVSWRAREGKWRAVAQVAGTPVFLGCFADEHEAGAAASAYRLAHMPFTNEDRRLRGRNRT